MKMSWLGGGEDGAAQRKLEHTFNPAVQGSNLGGSARVSRQSIDY